MPHSPHSRQLPDQQKNTSLPLRLLRELSETIYNNRFKVGMLIGIALGGPVLFDLGREVGHMDNILASASDTLRTSQSDAKHKMEDDMEDDMEKWPMTIDGADYL